MEGHEGSGEVLATLDERLASFFDPVTGSINYTSTAVVIVSDHGALMGLNYAFLTNGKVKAADPFAAIILPDSYLDGNGNDRSRRGNLERSSARLVTAFDLYETMRGFMGERQAHVLDWVSGADGQRHDRIDVHLLRHEALDRSCADVDIADVDCRCK